MIITYDSTRAVTVTKKDDHTYYVKMYSLEDYDLTFEEEIGGEPENYIKLKEVEQNAAGSEFAIIYFDDGIWFLRTFGKETRTPEEIAENEVEINALLDLDDYTMVNNEFPYPFATCNFVTDTRIFISVFYNYDRSHYHLIWDTKKRRMIGEPQKYTLDCNMKNFPNKSFYSEEKDEIYLFYRQGNAFIIDPNNVSNYKYEKIIDKDLGDMVLLWGQAMICRSSSSVYFFKRVFDKMAKQT